MTGIARPRWAYATVLAAWTLGCGPNAGSGDGDDGFETTSGTPAGTTSGLGRDDAEASGAPDDDPPPVTEPCVPEGTAAEAALRFHTVDDIQERIIDTTCSPFQQVCHADKEYPDLDGARSLHALVGAPCWDDDADAFDGCELPGDVVTFGPGSNEDWQTELAWAEHDGDDIVLTLRDAPPHAMADTSIPETIGVTRAELDGSTTYLGAFVTGATYTAGEPQVRIPAVLVRAADDELFASLRGGDPNRNGTFGGDHEPYAMVWPGAPERSYLLARVAGQYANSPPMPLANQPLTDDELAAISCWIEGLRLGDPDSADAPIDYCDCSYGQ